MPGTTGTPAATAAARAADLSPISSTASAGGPIQTSPAAEQARLRALTEKVQGRMVTLQARHAAAVADSDALALDAVSAKFEDAGMILSAADSAAQAAPLHDRASQRRKSAESAARALRLAAQCGGATTPAIRSAARPLPVTSREREIAVLVAEGLSNREIAERLTVSVRTVEGHIYRACIKLDVTDRDELAKIIWREVST